MATYTKTVDPNGGSAYASLALWEAGEQALYSATDIAIADCKRTGSTKDTSAFAVFGWNAGVIPKIIVNASYRHEGKPANTRASDGNFIYTLTSGASNNLRLGVADTVVDGLLIEPTANKGGIAQAGVALGSGNLYVLSCIVDGGGANTGVGIGHSNSGVMNVYNSVACNFDGAATGYGFSVSGASAVLNTYNCTAIKCRFGFVRVGGVFTPRNTGAFNCTNGGYAGTFTSATHNVSYDASAPGTPIATGKASYATYFTDYLNCDVHIKDTSLNLWGLTGVNLSGLFVDDIDGDVRSNWDIGADEFVSAGTTVTPGAASISLTGQAVAVNVTEIVDAATISAVGQAVTVAAAQTITPAAGGIVLTGQDVANILSTLEIPGVGAVSLQGQDVEAGISVVEQVLSAALVVTGKGVAVNTTVLVGGAVVTYRGKRIYVNGELIGAIVQKARLALALRLGL